MTKTSEYTRRRPQCTRTRHKFIRAWWGCKENPGCWDNGNGALVYVDVCRHCGCQRREVRSYCGRDHDNAVTYKAPDPDLARKAREEA
jgi:Rieske Fe-S protein